MSDIDLINNALKFGGVDVLGMLVYLMAQPEERYIERSTVMKETGISGARFGQVMAVMKGMGLIARHSRRYQGKRLVDRWHLKRDAIGRVCA